jgi:hypothetical protein
MKQLTMMAQAMGVSCPVMCGGEIMPQPTPPTECDAGAMPSMSACVKDSLSRLASATGLGLVVTRSGSYSLSINLKLAQVPPPQFAEAMVCPVVQTAASCYSPACCQEKVNSSVKASVDEQMEQFAIMTKTMGLTCPVMCGIPPPPSACDVRNMASVSDCVNRAMGVISSKTEPSLICPIIQQAASCYSPSCCSDPAVKASANEQMKQLAMMAQAMGTTCPVTCGAGGSGPPSPPICAAPALCLGSNNSSVFTEVSVALAQSMNCHGSLSANPRAFRLRRTGCWKSTSSWSGRGCGGCCPPTCAPNFSRYACRQRTISRIAVSRGAPSLQLESISSEMRPSSLPLSNSPRTGLFLGSRNVSAVNFKQR